MPKKKVKRRVDKSFVFRDVVSILKPTGLKASNLHQLRDGIADSSDECIFHNTYQYVSKGLIQEYTNDFAYWAGEKLEERALAEQLSNIDPYAYKLIEDLRVEVLKVIDYYMENFPEPRDVMPGDEFYFNETITYVFPVGLRARNLAEFLIALKYVDVSSIYYHFYEARIRLRKEADDFSKWLDEVMEAKDIATDIRNIDPFMHNIEGIRDHLISVLETGLRAQMERIR